MSNVIPLQDSRIIENEQDFSEVPHFDKVKLSVDYPIFNESDFYGIAGEVAKLGSYKSEADPVAVYYSFLTASAALVGNYAYLQVGDSTHSARLFTALVGVSSRARKGTSQAPVERVIRRCEDVLKNISNIDFPLSINGGLSSSEGLIYAVRDVATELKNNGNPIWDGVEDKRLLLVEEELAQIFKVAKREGNTLTPILRKAWDGGTLASLTKNSRVKSTNPHINILGHITQYELKSLMSEDDVYNGLANRFLWCCVRRSKSIALPEPMDDSKVFSLGIKLSEIFKRIYGNEKVLVELDSSAREYWQDVYHKVSVDRHGSIGAVTSRLEAHTLRLSLLFAILDGELKVSEVHINAALSVIRYSLKSAEFIFTSSVLDSDEAGDAKKLINALNEQGQMTQTEIHKLFNRNKSSTQLGELLKNLQAYGQIESQKMNKGRGVLWQIRKFVN